jgi:hypothetical protein
MQFVDTFSHVVTIYLANYKFYLSFYKYVQDKSETYNFDDIKLIVFREVGIQNSFKNNTTITNSSSESLDYNWDFIYKQFIYTVWCSSDLFFWIIYFAAFIPNNFFSRDKNLKSNFSEKNCITRIYAFFKVSFYNFVSLIDEYEQFVEAHFNSFRIFLLLKSVFNLKFLFRVLCIICLIGALLKFFFNLKCLILTLMELILIEDFFRNNL